MTWLNLLQFDLISTQWCFEGEDAKFCLPVWSTNPDFHYAVWMELILSFYPFEFIFFLALTKISSGLSRYICPLLFYYYYYYFFFLFFFPSFVKSKWNALFYNIPMEPVLCDLGSRAVRDILWYGQKFSSGSGVYCSKC